MKLMAIVYEDDGVRERKGGKEGGRGEKERKKLKRRREREGERENMQQVAGLTFDFIPGFPSLVGFSQREE